MGAYVALKPIQQQHHRYWLAAFSSAWLLSVGAAIWQDDRKDAEMEMKLTGGQNYVYLKADERALRDRDTLVRLWICSTGHMFDVRIHPFPYKVNHDHPDYGKFPGFGTNYIGQGCRWAPNPLPPGKYSISLEARNGYLVQTLEIMKTESGPYLQDCTLDRDNKPLDLPGCQRKHPQSVVPQSIWSAQLVIGLCLLFGFFALGLCGCCCRRREA